MRRVTQLLKDSFYVGDCVSSLPTEEVSQFQEESTGLLHEAGMDLRKWRSNSGTICAAESQERCMEKLLGMYWDCEADQVFVSAPSATKPALWSRKAL